MKTNFRKKIGNIAVMAGMFMLLAGCGPDDRKVDMSCTVTDITTIEVPQSVKVVGLGEGNRLPDLSHKGDGRASGLDALL